MLVPLGCPCEAPAEAEAHRGYHQDAQVGGHQLDGSRDVVEVEPVKGRAQWLARSREPRKLGAPASGWEIPKVGVSYLVTPMCRERVSQGLPAEKNRKQVRQRAHSMHHSPCPQAALGDPRSQKPWSPGCLWLLRVLPQHCLYQRAQAQPGKAGQTRGLAALPGRKGIQSPMGSMWPQGS